MSNQVSKHVGSQLSRDTRPATNLTPQRPIPPGFSNREEWEGFQLAIKSAHANGILPQGIKNAEQAIVIAQKGRELGLDPLYSLSVIHMINGSPALEGEVMLALVLKRYPKASIEWLEVSNKKASVRMAREDGQPSTFTFTIEEANQAGLTNKDVWKKYTADMLSWRAVARAVRRLFPECIMGCLTPDEARSLGGPQELRDLKDAKTLDSEFVSGSEPIDSAPAALTAPAAEPVDIVTEDLVKAGTEIASDDEGSRPKPQAPKPKPVPEPDPFPFELDNKAYGEFQFTGGKYFGKSVKDLTKDELTAYLEQLRKRQASVGGNDPLLKDMIRAVSGFLGVK